MATESKALEAAFGRTLRDLRQARSLSQEKLALEAGLDRTFISMMERGTRQPSLGTLFSLSVALGMTPSALVGVVEKQLGRVR